VLAPNGDELRPKNGASAQDPIRDVRDAWGLDHIHPALMTSASTRPQAASTSAAAAITAASSPTSASRDTAAGASGSWRISSATSWARARSRASLRAHTARDATVSGSCSRSPTGTSSQRHHFGLLNAPDVWQALRVQRGALMRSLAYQWAVLPDPKVRSLLSRWAFTPA
jgi:hypothetical protein